MQGFGERWIGKGEPGIRKATKALRWRTPGQDVRAVGSKIAGVAPRMATRLLKTPRSSGTHEVLTQDLTCTGFDPALTIQGPGGQLDMRRHTLPCAGSGTDGIDLTGAGALLQKGAVVDCDEGVVLDGSRQRVTAMILQNNSIDGLFIASGAGHRVTATTARK